MIDILDENEDVIGTMNIREAHANYKLHKSIHVWIEYGDKVLIQRRSSNLKFFPSKYDCAAAGHVNSNEIDKVAALRETFEELGIRLEERDLLLAFKTKIREYENYEIRTVFIVNKEIDISKSSVPSREVDELKWINKSQLFDYMNEPDFINYTKVYKDQLNKFL